MKYLRELRAQMGVSQQVVADYLEITRQAYSNYENGNRTPDNETLLKLGEFFGVSVDELLRGKKEKPIPEFEDELELEIMELVHQLPPDSKKALLGLLSAWPKAGQEESSSARRSNGEDTQGFVDQDCP